MQRRLPERFGQVYTDVGSSIFRHMLTALGTRITYWLRRTHACSDTSQTWWLCTRHLRLLCLLLDDLRDERFEHTVPLRRAHRMWWRCLKSLRRLDHGCWKPWTRVHTRDPRSRCWSARTILTRLQRLAQQRFRISFGCPRTLTLLGASRHGRCRDPSSPTCCGLLKVVWFDKAQR